VDVAAPPRWPIRVLVVAIVASLGIGGGIIAARVTPEAAEQVVASPEPVAVAAAPPDLAPLAATGLSLLDGLTVALPQPEASPQDARAPTAEVRHGMLEIPSIGLSQPFFEGVTLTAIDRGPSHWPGTAMPGKLGNVVVAGHRTTRTRPFWDLDLVQPGDELIFTMDSGERYVYALDSIEIVDDEAIHIIDQGYGYTATLFGCHPKGSARQRIVGHFTMTSATPAPAPAAA
jgi:sortase A